MTDVISEKTKQVESKTYELGYLLVPTVGDGKVSAEATNVRDILEKNGNIISSNEPTKKELAYDMTYAWGSKKQIFGDGYFGSFVFDTTVDVIGSVEKELKKNKHMLRFLLITRNKNTLVAPKRIIPRAKTEIKKPRIPEKKVEINEKDLDKTIEELVVE